MGSWNGTDALTQLAIHNGEKVVAFLLVPRKGYRGDAVGGGFSNADDVYGPVGLPVRGKYNDYGGIEDAERGLALEFMTDWAWRGLENGSIKLSKDADIEDADPKKPGFEDFVKWVERGWVSLDGRHGWGADGPLCLMLVLERIHADVMKAAAKVSEHAWVDGFGKPTYRETFEKKAATFLEAVLRDKDERDQTPEKFREDLHEARDELWRFEFANGVLKYDFQNFLIRTKSDAGKTAEARDLIVDHFVFKRFLELTRKHYSPQSGAGSHYDAIGLQAALAKTALAICDKRSKERD